MLGNLLMYCNETLNAVYYATWRRKLCSRIYGAVVFYRTTECILLSKEK